jgi:ACS family glucarate transporter-like MFS transporter
VPLFAGGLGNMAAGALMPRLARRMGLARARRILAVGGFLLAAVAFLFPGHFMERPLVVMALMGLGGFFADLSMPSSWSACMDVAGKFSGTYSGAMNMMGNFGGTVGPVLVGYLLTWTARDYAVIFNVSAGVFFLAALCWLFIDPVTPLADKPPPAA